MSSALASKEVSSQTEVPGNATAVQVSSCRECHQLALEMDGSRANCCVRCDQVDYLLGLVADEVDRLRSIKESEQEIDWWNHALISLKPELGQPPEKGCDQRDPVSSPHHNVGRVLKGNGKWEQVHSQVASEPSSCPPRLPRCL